MSKTRIETEDYTLPVAETRLLARTLFESGWIAPTDLKKLLCLWTLDAPDSEIKRAVDELFVPAWLAANTKFNIAANELAEKLGRELTEDERLGIAFPHGKYYADAQTIITEWFESQVKNVATLLN